MSADQATARPWIASEDGYGRWLFYGGYNGTIKNADGEYVYSGPSSFRALRGKTHEQAEANARLIVHAVNNYEALVSALDVLVDAARSGIGVYPARANAEKVLAAIIEAQP